MNKKIIASLLSACLVVAAAVPAFAISSQSGLDSDITMLSFQKDSYTVKQGSDNTLDLSAEVMAFASVSKLVQEPNLLWSWQNDNNFAFDVDDNGIATAIESTGTAVVTVTTQDGKVKATTKLVAGGASRDQDATGFTFEKSSYTLLTGPEATVGKGDKIVMLPTPTGSTFTADQISLITGQPLVIEFTSGDKPTLNVTGKVNADNNKIEFVVDNTALKGITTTMKSVTVKYDIKNFPASYPNGTQKEVNVARTIRIDSKLGRVADAIYGLGNKTIEVGEKVKAADLFKQGPSAHNIPQDVSYGTDFVDQNATVLDYADIMDTVNADDDQYIQGIAVGKNKITADIGGKQASVIVEVVAKGQLPNELVKISTTSATLKINEPLKLTVSNVPAGKDVTWKVSDNTTAQISVFKGPATTVYPKKAGKVTVSAMIDGVVVATSEITVTSENAVNRPATSK